MQTRFLVDGIFFEYIRNFYQCRVEMKQEMRILMMGLVLQCHAGSLFLWSQDRVPAEILAGYEEKYGNDPCLVNGEKYYYPYSRSEGDPFLEPSPKQATLHISGEVFEGQTIRYDIYNQYLVLEYVDAYGATSSLVLRDELVEAFSYEGRLFKKMKGPEGKERFFQVVFEGPVSCYFLWGKEYRLDLRSGTRNYYFTEPERKAYLVMDHRFHSYRNNRSFSRIFGKEYRKLIRQYMRQHQIRIREATGRQMFPLMEYCNSLINEAT